MLFDDAMRSGNLSQGDLAVVSYISQHPHEVVHMTSRELAGAAFVSPSTVVRLCKKAGFASFGDMKVALSHEMAHEESYEVVDSDFPELGDASVAQVLARVSSMTRQAVRETERLLAQVNWTPILDALEKAGGVTFYALGYSVDACSPLARDFRRLGKRVRICKEGSDAREWSAGCPRDDFSVLVSYSGMTPTAIDSARILAKRGLRSVSVTSEGNNELRRLTTWNIPIARTEHAQANDRISHLQSVTAQSYALGALFALYYGRDYAGNTRAISSMLERQGIRIRREQGGEAHLEGVGSLSPTWAQRQR